MTVRLTSPENDLLAGHSGAASRWAIDFQMKIGNFFGARRLVPVRSAHVMCDGEAVGAAGAAFLEEWANSGASVVIPTTTDPRSIDFSKPDALRQGDSILQRELGIMSSMRRMGAVACNTCVNYQTIDIPTFGEHLGWGDTGAVIFANAVAGARSNFEGGPAALAASFAGRVAEYGFHLDEPRLGSILVHVEDTPTRAADWGALGALVGRAAPGYWTVPVFDGIDRPPTVDELKQLGAALASYGSHGMFHAVGITPEARTRREAFGGGPPQREISVTQRDIDDVYRSFVAEDHAPDLVVFGTPQLSLWEVRDLASKFAGQEVKVPTFLTTSPQAYATAVDGGYVSDLESAGATVLAGVCFYVMTAREVAQNNGFRTIVTDSAKLANIIEGYGYNPVFRPTEQCVDVAVTGRIRS